MAWWQGLILGILQGFTEFLPISSSGHLVLLQHFFGLSLSAQDMLAFDIFIHFGTLLALLYFYRKELAPLAAGAWSCALALGRKPEARRSCFQVHRHSLILIAFLALATLPAVGVGLFLKDKVEMAFSDMRSIGIQFIVTAISLFSIRWVSKKGNVQGAPLSWWRALAIGVAQALAIVPAISRSGSTIVTGIWLKMSPEEATRFSFLLAIPAIAGATLLAFFDLQSASVLALPAAWWGFAASALVGWLCLGAFLRIVREGKLHLFAYYCLFLGILCIWAFY